MKPTSDAWYVRLPDGRLLKASSTRAVRHHLMTGRIPVDSRVRRHADEEWTILELTHEFADFVREYQAKLAAVTAEPESEDQAPPLPPRTDVAGIASRLDPLQLQTIGVRGFFEELLAALDSTLVRMKLVPAAVAGLLGSLVVLTADLTADLALLPPVWMKVTVGAVLLLITAACTSLLTQMNYVELCRLRPAHWHEARTRWFRNFFHLTLAGLVVVGGILCVIYGLRQLPGWLLSRPEYTAQEFVPAVAAVACLLLEVVLVMLLAFSLLLAPIVVIEECTFVGALVQWARLVGAYFSRILLYEALALVPAILGALVALVPVELAAAGQLQGLKAVPDTAAGLAAGIELNWLQPALRMLRGLAVTPLIAYLAVANVFIYLNLRYEQRDR